MSLRRLTFNANERSRLADVCKALGTTFEEFAHFATMRAVDECEGYARDAELIKAYYEGRPLIDGTTPSTHSCPFDVGHPDYEELA